MCHQLSLVLTGTHPLLPRDIAQLKDTIAELEAGGNSSGDEEDEGPAELLDWRAKTSAF